MAKATTKLNPQDRVILFCTATGIDIARPRPAAGYDGAPGLATWTDKDSIPQRTSAPLSGCKMPAIPGN